MYDAHAVVVLVGAAADAVLVLTAAMSGNATDTHTHTGRHFISHYITTTTIIIITSKTGETKARVTWRTIRKRERGREREPTAKLLCSGLIG